MESGSLAEWVGGVSTFLAFGGASWAVVYARRAAHHAGAAIEIERKRDDERDLERRIQHAAQFAAWLPTAVDLIGGQVTVTFGGEQQATELRDDVAIVPERLPVTLRNSSDLPIQDVVIQIYVRERRATEWLLAGNKIYGVAPPGETDTVEAADAELTAAVRRVLADSPGTRETPPSVAIGWTLTDNAGVRWRRKPGCRLAEI